MLPTFHRSIPCSVVLSIRLVQAVPAPLLQLQAVEKSFTGVRAVKPLSFSVAAGETLGLIGENGAGKSTLIKILSGVYPPDAGVIYWRGREVHFTSPHDAMEAGIATIHQELAYFGHLTVAENLLLGERWPRHRWGGVNWRELHREAGVRLARFNLDISTRRAFSELSAAHKQEVAIVRALNGRARLLILDEPTASLSEPEVKRLFVHLERLRGEGVAILYISHRLDEILKLTDRVAVLRDGELVATYRTADVNVNRMIKDMVGRPLEQVYPRVRRRQPGSSRCDEAGSLRPKDQRLSTPLGSHDGSEVPLTPSEWERGSEGWEKGRFIATNPQLRSGQPLLELDHVTRKGMFHNISFALRSGEIVGLAGLVGAGRSELARAIYGLYPCDDGAMRLYGLPGQPKSPHQALAVGLVYLPEERKRQGLVPDHSVGESISIGFSDLLSRWGLIDADVERRRVQDAMRICDVRAHSSAQPIGTLSGGNQQKAILARWLERDPKVILLDEPTRGVDVGAKAEIHQLMDRLAGRGCAVLLVSSDLPEVLGMSDRVLVMHRGAIAAELRGEQMTQENVLRAASGLPLEN